MPNQQKSKGHFAPWVRPLFGSAPRRQESAVCVPPTKVVSPARVFHRRGKLG